MNFYSWLWKWLETRAPATPRNSFDRIAKLSLRKLENRQVMSVSAAFNVLTGMLDVAIDIDQAHETPGYTEIEANGKDVTVSVASDGSHDVLINGHTFDVGGGNLLHANDVTGLAVHDNTSFNTNIDLSAVSAANGFTHQLNGLVNVVSGSGNDTIIGSTFSNVIVVGTGNDNIFGNGGNDLYQFSSTFGNDTISNTAGATNTLDLSEAASNLAVNLQTQLVTVPGDPTQSISFSGTNFGTILGNSLTSNTFQGLDATSTWSLSSSGDTYSSGTTHTGFSGFQSLIGGAADNTFDFLDPTAPLTSLTTSVTGTTYLDGGILNSTTVDFQGAVVVQSTTTINATDVTFGSTVDGDNSVVSAQGLIVNASGSTHYDSTVGGTTALDWLDNSGAGQIGLNGNVTTNWSQTYAGAVFLNSDSTLTTSNSNVTFGSTLDGNANLTIVEGLGAVSFNGVVGGSSALSSLTVGSDGTTIIGTSNVNTLGNQTYNDAVQIGANTTLNSSAGGAVTFNNTLDSVLNQNYGLTVITSGTVTFNEAVGAADPLSSLTTGGGGLTVINATNLITTGDQTYNDAVQVGVGTTLTSGAGGAILFGSTLDSTSGQTNSVSVLTSGTITFDGPVGGTDQLLSLITDGGGTTLINTSTVNTTGDQTYNDAVQLGVDTTLSSSSTGNITFANTVDSAPGQNNALTVLTAGTVAFESLVGGTDQLSSLTTGGGGTTDINASNITTTGSQTYNDAVQLSVNTTLYSSSGAAITFDNTLDSTPNQTNSLTVLTSGIVTFDATVGGADQLSSLTTDGGGITVINTANVTTTGNQTYNDAVQVGIATTLQSTAAGSITFANTLDSTSGQANSLTVLTSGTVTFDGIVGGTDQLSSLTTDGGGTTVINASNVNTIGYQTYNDAVQLAVDTTLTSSANGAVTFGNTLDSEPNQTNALMVLTGGTVTFDGTVGGTDRLSSLTTTGGTTVINSANVSTTGSQTYNDAVQLGVNTTLDSSAGGGIAFNSTLDSTPGQTNSLTVTTSGSVMFNATVGGADQLSSLTTNGGGTTVIGTSNVNTTGDQTYTDAVQLGVDTTLSSSASGAITFVSTLDSAPGQANSLSVLTSGTVTFDGTVGGTDQLSSLTTGGGGTTVINTANVKTDGNQTYNDAVQLGADTTLNSSAAGTIAFNNTLDSGLNETNALTVLTGGTVSFNGIVGGINQLSSLTTDGGGTTVISTSSITTTSHQTYNDAVQLGVDTTLDSTAGGAITFSNTLDSTTGLTNALTVLTTGVVTFDGVVGGTNQLSNLTTSGGGTTVINTSNVNTSGNQTYNDAVQLAIDTTLASSAGGAIAFNNTLDSTAGQTNALTALSAGTVVFNGIVGGTDLLSSVTTGGGGLTVFNTSNVNTSGAQTYNDAVQVGANATLDSTAGGAILFNSTVDSTTGQTHALTVLTSGTVAFNGIVGGTDQLSNLTTSGGGTTIVNTSNINTTGNQTYNDAVQLEIDTTLDITAAGAISFNNTLDSTPGQTNALTVLTSGSVIFNATVGGTDQLSNLTTSGGGTTIINTANVNTVANQTYNDAVQLDVDTTLNSSGAGTIAFNNTLDSTLGQNNALTVQTSGTVAFNGIVGGTSQLSTLTTGGGGLTLVDTSNINTTGNQTFKEAVQLGVDTTLDSSSGGSVTLTSTLDSTTGLTNALTVLTSGIVTFDGVVGGTNQLSSLTTSGGGTTVINTANINTSGNQTYNDAVQLNVDTTLNSSAAGTVTFNNTLDSTSGETNALSVLTSGTVAFNGLVGVIDQLSSLTTGGGGLTVINTADVNTTGNQTYNDAVQVGMNTTLDSSAGGAVAFNSTVNSTTGMTNSLTVLTSGTVSFNAIVGGTDQLSNLTTDGGGITVINTSNVNTSVNQTYNDAVQLNVDTTLNSSAGGAITFNNTLDSTSGLTNALTAVTSGLVTFNGTVGGTDQLSNLTTSGGGTTVINTANVNTVANQTYNDAVQLEVDTTLNSSAAGTIAFNNTLDSTPGETNALTVQTAGTVTFSGIVGGTDQLSNLTTTGGGTTVINTSNVNTTGNQTYNDAVQLGVDTTLDSSSGGSVTFVNSVDSTSGLTNALTVLTSGTVTFDGVVGGTNQLSNLTTDGGGTTVINTAAMNTSGNQTYNDAVQLGVNTTLTSSSGGTIAFNNTLDSSVGEMNALSVMTSGTVAFNATVGGADQLSSLLTDGGGTTVINTANINTTGNQTYSDAVQLGTDTTLDSSTGGSITFNNTLDSVLGQTNALTVLTSGVVTFNAIVGGTDQLSNLTTGGNGTTVIGTSNVNTTGNQTYNDAVQLSVDTALNSSAGGAITFSSTLDSTSGLTNALTVLTAGVVTFDGVVGGTDQLSTLTTDGGGVTVINTSNVNTTGNQTYNDAVQLGVDTTLNSSLGGTIAFNNTLDSAPNQNNALTVLTSASVVFNGTVGGTDQLSSLMTDGGGTTDINTANVNTTGNQTYNDAVQLGVDTTLDSSSGGAIAFNNMLDSAAGLTNALTVLTSGIVEFNGTVGGVNQLSNLTTDGGGVTVINTANVTTTQNQTYHDAVQLGVDTVLTSTASGLITFNNTLDSTPSQTIALTVLTAGTATFNGIVGGTDQLSSLSVDGGGTTVINTSNVTTTGNQTYDETLQLGVDATLSSRAGGAITFSSTVDSSPGQTTALTVNTAGTVTFDAPVGGIDQLSSLTINGGGTTVINTANITTTNNQTYNSNLLLGSNLTLTTTLSGDITVNGTIDGTADLSQSLTLSPGAGNIHVTGDIGATTRLGDLLITQANNSNFDGSVNVNTFQQLATTPGGTTTFGDSIGNDAINTYGAIAGSTDGFQFTGHALQFADTSSSLDTHGNNVTMTTDELTLPTTFVNAIGQTVTIQTLTDSTSIGINDASQNLNLTNAALSLIHSQNVVIGQVTNTGGIKVGTDGDVSQDANYTLLTAANVDVNGTFQLDQSNSLTVNAGQDLNVSVAGALQTDAGQTTLNVGNDATIAGTVSTNSGDLQLNVVHDVTVTPTGTVQSSSGMMTVDAGHDVTIQGLVAMGTGALNITASDDINVSGSITTDSGETTLGAIHDIYLTSTAQVSSVTADLTLTAGTGVSADDGQLKMDNGAVINAGSGMVTMTADGNVTLGQVITTNSTASAIQITSNFAAILSDQIPGIANLKDQSAGSLVTLTAVSGIGDPGSIGGSPIQTNIADLNAVNTTSGDIRIDDLNPLGFAIQQVNQEGGGNIAVTSQGTMVVTDPGANGLGVHSQGGSISLSAEGNPSDLVIQNTVDTAGADISLMAGNNLVIGESGNGSVGQVNSNGGNVNAFASTSATGGQVLMYDGAVINASSGQINMQADGDITLGDIITTNATASAVLLVSRSGGIVDGGDSNTYNIEANSVGAIVTIQTSTGIGSETGFGANPQLETNLYELSITNGSPLAPYGASAPVSTNIGIDNASSLNLLQVQQNNLGNVIITAQGTLEVLQSGTGVTATQGNVALVASGQGSDALINNVVQTQGGNIGIAADLDVNVGATSQISSSGGSVTMVAGANTSFADGNGQILMSPGSLVNAAGGTVRMTAPLDITLTQVSTGGLVSIDSSNGAIINGETGVTNIASGSLALHAVNGIGSDTALVISTSQLAADNAISGNIRLDNVSGATMTIGTADGMSGITNSGDTASDIAITSNYTIVLAQQTVPTDGGFITNLTGGNITLTSTGVFSDIDIHALIAAIRPDGSGNGSITINAGNNMEIFGSTSAFVLRVLVEGVGNIELAAAEKVIFAPNAVVQSGTGSIVNAPPYLANVIAQQLTAQGVVTVTGDFARLGEKDFSVIVNWGDGTISAPTAYSPGTTHKPYTVGGTIVDDPYATTLGPQSFTYSHFYAHNPDPTNPAAPIPISITVQQDPHIFVTFGATSLVAAPTGNQDQTTVNVHATVPGSGIENFIFDTTPVVIYLTIPDPIKYDDTTQHAANQIVDNSTMRLDMTRYEVFLASERRIFFDVLSPDGKVLQRVEMPESVLDDMLGIISRLPDGKYRFMMQEPGEDRERLLIEFQVRQGKIFDGVDRSNRPSSTNNLKQEGTDGDQDMPVDALKAIGINPANDASSLDVPAGDTMIADANWPQDDHAESSEATSDNDDQVRNRWMSMTARRAWKRAEEISQYSQEASACGGSVVAAPEVQSFSHAEHDVSIAQGSMMLVGAATLLVQAAPFDMRKSVEQTAARLSRGARLFRKTTKPR